MTSGEFWLAIATIIAVVLGPIFAVLVTRFVDNSRAAKSRKLDIYRALMKTRLIPLHMEHVSALNLIEVEFIDHPKVITSWKEYLSNLSEKSPPEEEREIYEQWRNKRNSLLTKLIYEISQVLKIKKIEQLDILKGNYLPQGWESDAWDKLLIRKGLVSVLLGKQSISIKAEAPQPNTETYPPPPDGGLKKLIEEE